MSFLKTVLKQPQISILLSYFAKQLMGIMTTYRFSLQLGKHAIRSLNNITFFCARKVVICYVNETSNKLSQPI